MPVIQECIHCKKLFPSTASRVKAGKGKTCSKECRIASGKYALARTPIADRFWAKVDQSNLDGCWTWTGARNNQGYGQLSIGGFKGRLISAHRVAWEITHGPIPAGMNVCHRCDNGAGGCVRPDHLFLGDRSANMQDMVSKGRNVAVTQPHRVARGQRSGAAKLTDNAVREIRLLAGTMTHQQIADRFGVSQRAVFFVIHRQTWKHVE